ncbi:MAG: rhamnulokinase [Clostridia bacterium]|nr:rhamnulokinase [Clostridia bacterium]
MTYYLAIDIGASSGRHILGHIEDGRLVLEEIYRFENNIIDIDGYKAWDIERLVSEVKRGIRRAGELGHVPKSVAIDTWGVDYVLLDKDMREILPAVSYRDPRGERYAKEVAQIIPQSELYRLTGIQMQPFNTIYQLYADKLTGRLDNAEHFLMIPDYLAYRLTGVLKNEYTNATTTNLVSPITREWDTDILDTLGIPRKLFRALSLPGDTVGSFSPEVERETGYSATVTLSATHDTASAVAACPIDGESIYISSGTWSLIGTENTDAVLTDEALAANFTNEGGIEYRYRFLKNIMGMWLFQSIRRELGGGISYDEMMHMAMESDYRGLIDPSDPVFLNPDSMIGAIRSYLGDKELLIRDVLSSVYHSLAASYAATLSEIEKISGKKISNIHIVGGGSKDSYLNSLTARYTARPVLIGLMEATATGNLLSQIMRDEGITLGEARKIVKNTFSVKEITQ